MSTRFSSELVDLLRAADIPLPSLSEPPSPDELNRIRTTLSILCTQPETEQNLRTIGLLYLAMIGAKNSTLIPSLGHEYDNQHIPALVLPALPNTDFEIPEPPYPISEHYVGKLFRLSEDVKNDFERGDDVDVEDIDALDDYMERVAECLLLHNARRSSVPLSLGTNALGLDLTGLGSNNAIEPVAVSDPSESSRSGTPPMTPSSPSSSPPFSQPAEIQEEQSQSGSQVEAIAAQLRSLTHLLASNTSSQQHQTRQLAQLRAKVEELERENVALHGEVIRLAAAEQEWRQREAGRQRDLGAGSRIDEVEQEVKVLKTQVRIMWVESLERDDRNFGTALPSTRIDDSTLAGSHHQRHPYDTPTSSSASAYSSQRGSEKPVGDDRYCYTHHVHPIPPAPGLVHAQRPTSPSPASSWEDLVTRNADRIHYGCASPVQKQSVLALAPMGLAEQMEDMDVDGPGLPMQSRELMYPATIANDSAPTPDSSSYYEPGLPESYNVEAIEKFRAGVLMPNHTMSLSAATAQRSVEKRRQDAWRR